LLYNNWRKLVKDIREQIKILGGKLQRVIITDESMNISQLLGSALEPCAGHGAANLWFGPAAQRLRHNDVGAGL